ncbi:MAG: hypothetical protein NTW16_08375, partial [Bacteroidetes bacterium]|nr:hypothetical protein [Bacteroidota bacterium]
YTWTFPPEATKIAGGTADDNRVTLTWTAVGTYVISVNYIEPTTLCEAASATLYPVNVKPLPEPSFIAGENAVCLNIPGHVYATESGKSNYIWNIPPEATKTAGGTATDNTVTLTWNTTGNQVLSVNYTEPATMCTAASATNYSVNVKPLPEPTFPTGENAVCLNIPGQVYSTESGKSDYVWTIPPEATKTAGGTASDNSVTLTWNTVGNSVISVNYTEPTTLCTAASATPYSVNVKPLPAPSFISGENDVCMNVPGQVYTTEPGKSNYTWTFPPEATKTAGGTVDDNSVTLTWTAVGRYDISVNYIEPTTLCTAASSTIYSVEVKPLPIPDISGPAIACVNTPGSKYYTQTGMSGYIWIVNGGTFTPGVTIDTINVIWTSTGSQHLTVNYTAMNGCTAATPAIFDVNVAVLPVPVITSGPGSICTDIATSYSTQAGMGEYEWIVSPNGAVTGANTDKIDVSWNSPGPKQVSVNYKMGPGCTGASPAIKSVTVNQSTPPVITSLLNPICLNSGTSYTTQSGMSNYNWTVSGGSFTTPTAGNSVSITWNTSGTQWVDVNFTNSDGCIAPFPSRYNVLVNPLPVTTITEGSGPTCNLQQHVYQTPPDPTCSFSWSAIPGTVVSPQGTNSATINWTSTGPATVSVMGTNTSTNCKSSSVYSTTVNPTPAPLFTPCFDLRTTPNANKITLRGGTPYLPVQGVYTGSRVTFNPVSGNYEFDPAGAAIGSYPIAYQYTNTFNCSASASSVTIQVVNSSLICGDSLTDVRDGTKYKTSLIGGRCWMQQNLRYGSTLLLTSEPQTDNCVSEKYCLPTDATCKSYGGLYQWDEVMSYSSTASNQGLCPPEWHVPSELEWQSMITDISAGITPPDGVAGSFLRDTFLNPGGFFALTKGLYYLSNSWAFTSGQLTGAMFWTATPDGADRSIARGVNSINLSTSKYSGSRNNAFSVRCVKD